MHSGRSDRPNRKPLIQLILGEDINISDKKLEAKINDLKGDVEDSEKAKYDELKSNIKKFFKDKDRKLYIIYQVAPEIKSKAIFHPAPQMQAKRETQEISIQQLDNLECIMGNITEKLEKVDDKESDATLPRSIETPGTPTTEETRKKEILPNLKSNNSFQEFDIIQK
jgi:hypothetical protein